MKHFRLLFFTLGLFPSLNSNSQVPEDAIRFSWQPHFGSARYMATGGVMGSLGGEVTAIFVNPAGLGMFKTREASFTPSLWMNRNESDYRDETTSSRSSHFQLGPMGLIVGTPSRSRKHTSSAFTLGLNQTAGFGNQLQYRGLNNYSSFSESFVEEFAKSGYSIGQVLTTQSPLPYTAAPALFTYLMDTVRINGVLQVKSAPEYLLDSGKAVRQDMTRTTRGGVYELALSYATNLREKWLYGVTVGIPMMNYRSDMTFREEDPTGDTANRFGYFSYNDNFRTTGAGLNLKFGVIFRPRDHFRLGLAFHTPSFMSLRDTRTTSLTTQIEQPSALYTVTSRSFTNNQPGEAEYGMTTPWKAVLSGSFVFREVRDVRRQRAFLSADVEYVRHSATRFVSQNQEPTAAEKAYYRSLNQVIKNEYKGTFNVRVGGEIKHDVFMGRLGFAYYSNPYRDEAFRGRRMMLSGGLGYRNHGIFIDLTYVQHLVRNVDLPYRLEDRLNTFAQVNSRPGQVIATVGFKL